MCHIKQTQKNFFPALLFIPIFIQCALFSDQHIWLPFISTFAWNAISKAIYAYCQLSPLAFQGFFSLYCFYPCIIKLNGHWLLVVTYSRLLLGILSLSHSSIYNSFSFWRWMNIFSACRCKTLNILIFILNRNVPWLFVVPSWAELSLCVLKL